jgi:hypothetical protein
MRLLLAVFRCMTPRGLSKCIFFGVDENWQPVAMHNFQVSRPGLRRSPFKGTSSSSDMNGDIVFARSFPGRETDKESRIQRSAVRDWKR